MATVAGLLQEDQYRSVEVGGMRVAILDDYFDTLRTLNCFDRLREHDVTVFNDHVQDVDQLADRLHDSEALVLIENARRSVRRCWRGCPISACSASAASTRTSTSRHARNWASSSPLTCTWFPVLRGLLN